MTKAVSVKSGSSAAPKNAREQQQANAAFDGKLRDAERRASETSANGKDDGTGEAAETTADRRVSAVKSRYGQPDGEQGREGMLPDGVMSAAIPEAPVRLTGVEAVVRASAAGFSNEQAAHIERMAAAIAEAVDKGGRSVYTVDFGSGTPVAQSAIIAFDQRGGVTINLLTPNPTIGQQGWVGLRNQLQMRLERRKFSVTAIEIEGIDRDVHRRERQS